MAISEMLGKWGRGEVVVMALGIPSGDICWWIYCY